MVAAIAACSVSSPTAWRPAPSQPLPVTVTWRMNRRAPPAASTTRTIEIGGARSGRERLFGTSSDRTGIGGQIGCVAMEQSQTDPAGSGGSMLSPLIDQLWEVRAELSPDDFAARSEVVAAVDALDQGTARVAR